MSERARTTQQGQPPGTADGDAGDRAATAPESDSDPAEQRDEQPADSTPTDTESGPTGATAPAEATAPTEATGPETGADAAIAALDAAGVDHVFGVQGGAIMPVYDALHDAGPRHVTMAHEQGAAHAADAYGQVTGRPGVCLATSGPGATNLVTGLADAGMDSDPVVALTGQVPTAFVGNDAFQETDTVGVTRPLTKQNYFAADADAVGPAVGEAVSLAAAGRPGPTLVDLPKDATTGPTGDAGPTPADADGDGLPEYYDVPDAADADAVEAAAGALARAKRPLVLAGGGVTKGDASAELRAFVRDLDVPAVTTMPGIGTVPEDEERCLGFAGMHGTGPANMAVSHCDCLVGVGTRFDDRLTGGVETFAPGAEVVHVDVDAAEISKNVHADYPLVGDAATVLDQLHGAMPAAFDAAGTDPSRYESWRERCSDWEDEYPMDYAAPADEPLKPQFVVEATDAATPDDAVVTTGVGQHQMWAAQYWTFRHPRTWISSHGLGTMGYGLPAAIGAKVAAPDREVVCFEGDGSFLMTVQELSVAVREGLDLTVVVLNNAAIGMVRQWQDAFFEGRHVASEYDWAPDFAALAEAFGARGFVLDDRDEVSETLSAAVDHDGPAVVDARVDPTENVYPMVASGGDNARFALAEDQL